jgi:hypothetical protein
MEHRRFFVGLLSVVAAGLITFILARVLVNRTR